MSRVVYLKWAPSSEFVSSSIPSWQILTAHAQPFRGARDLAFCLKVPLDSLPVWASSEGSGETARIFNIIAFKVFMQFQNLSEETWSSAAENLIELCFVACLSNKSKKRFILGPNNNVLELRHHFIWWRTSRALYIYFMTWMNAKQNITATLTLVCGAKIVNFPCPQLRLQLFLVLYWAKVITELFCFDNISFQAHVLNQLFLQNESSISQASYCQMVLTICQLFKKQTILWS